MRLHMREESEFDRLGNVSWILKRKERKEYGKTNMETYVTVITYRNIINMQSFHRSSARVLHATPLSMKDSNHVGNL